MQEAQNVHEVYDPYTSSPDDLPVFSDSDRSSRLRYIPKILYENPSFLQTNSRFPEGRIFLSNEDVTQLKWMYKYTSQAERILAITDDRGVFQKKKHKIIQLSDLVDFRGVGIHPPLLELLTRYDPSGGKWWYVPSFNGEGDQIVLNGWRCPVIR